MEPTNWEELDPYVLTDGYIKNEFGRCSFRCATGYVPAIYGLYINDRFRRKEHAREMLRMVISRIREIQPKGCIMTTAVPQEGSIPVEKLRSFYESLGLTVVER